MNRDPARLLSALRDAFDRGFGAPPPAADEAREVLIAMRLGEARYALRLDELGGIQQAVPIVPLPGGVEAFRGLVGVRGRALAVYDPGPILGHAPTAEAAWLVLAGGGEPFGLVFSAFEGFLQPGDGAIAASAARGELVPRIANDGEHPRGIIDLQAVRAWIADRVAAGRNEES